MIPQMARVYTQYYPNLLTADHATALFEYLKDNIEWENGIMSRVHGFTRKAKPMQLGMDQVLDSTIAAVFEKMGIDSAGIYGVYLNYYRDGNDFTPAHSHPGLKQIVISLGATRTLTMGSSSYEMKNGDVIIFGSSIHGVPKDPECKDGRISIALFLRKE
jgi:hypothetical protein